MITIDGDCIIVDDSGGRREIGLGTPEGFALLSQLWLRSGWDVKYVYSFTWLGRPIIQLPEDMFRLQEVIWQVQPEVIIETGVAHGGSLVFYATLCRALGRGRVIGVEIELRPHNRAALDTHPLRDLITLIDGDSTDPAVVQAVREQIRSGESVLVVLDSRHSRDHVLAELRAYGPLVSPGSYLVALDGIMADLVGAPRSQPDWSWNNPRAAVAKFLQESSDFLPEEPPFLFNEGTVHQRVTYWPGGFLKKVGTPRAVG